MAENNASDKSINEADHFFFGLLVGLLIMLLVLLLVSNRTRIVKYGERECVYVGVFLENGEIVQCYDPELPAKED